MKYLRAILRVMGTLLLVCVTGVLLAAGFNFGYEFHPRFLFLAVLPWIPAVALSWLTLPSFGTSPGRRLLAISCAVPLVGLSAVVAAVELQKPDRAEIDARNAPLLAQIQPFPGSLALGQQSVRIDPSTDSFEEGYLNSTEGYQLSRSERLAAGISMSEATTYYSSALETAGFRPRSFDSTFYGDGTNVVPGMDIIGRGGKALIYVQIGGDAPSGLEVHVLADYEGNRLCGSPSDGGCW
jgi:hypothetical protein